MKRRVRQCGQLLLPSLDGANHYKITESACQEPDRILAFQIQQSFRLQLIAEPLARENQNFGGRSGVGKAREMGQKFGKPAIQ